MRARSLQNALATLRHSISQVETVIDQMRSEHDPLALHIFAARRAYRNMSDTKGGKRHHTAAMLSWQQARDLGFRGNLDEWERLMGAVAPPH